MLKRLSVILALMAVLLPVASNAQERDVVVYVVRHAERAEDGTNDPPISEVGEVRAQAVADLLDGVGLTHIHTTDYRRTRMSCEPTVRATGLEPEVYDPRDMAAFARRLSETPGRHLVMGHSNTGPELVAALGGDPGEPIGEMEYDRAYVVVVLPGGAAGSAELRYGAGPG